LRVRVCARRRSDWGTYDWRFRNEQTSASIAACGSDLRRHNLARKIAARTTKRGNCQALLGFNHMHWLAAVTGNAGGSFAGASEQTRGTFLYGVGADYVLAKHWSIRAEYRYERSIAAWSTKHPALISPVWIQTAGHTQPNRPQASFSVFESRGRRRGTGVQPDTRTTQL